MNEAADSVVAARHDMRQMGLLMIVAAFIGFFIEPTVSRPGAMVLAVTGISLWWIGLGMPWRDHLRRALKKFI